VNDTSAHLDISSTRLPTTCEWVHLLMHGHFWSCDKDGGHTIQFVIAENPILYANLMALSFIETELWVIKVLHCGNRDFQLFCSCDPVLGLLTIIYEFDPYSLEIQRVCKFELPMSRLSKVIVWQTDRQTDRQRHDGNYIPRHFVGGQQTVITSFSRHRQHFHGIWQWFVIFSFEWMNCDAKCVV